MVSKITFQNEVQKLPLPATEKWSHGVFDIECFKHGSMSVILYTPRIHDYQTPHEQDEVDSGWYFAGRKAGCVEGS
jgi:hypothetical protein